MKSRRSSARRSHYSWKYHRGVSVCVLDVCKLFDRLGKWFATVREWPRLFLDFRFRFRRVWCDSLNFPQETSGSNPELRSRPVPAR